MQLVWFALIAALPRLAWASTEAAGDGYGTWAPLAVVLLAAIVGGELATRLKQPPVLGELLAGVLLGNAHLLGFHAAREVDALPVVRVLADLGVLILLFDVGLESSVREMRRVARSSGLVALVGVALPMAGGVVLARLLLPNAPMTVALFAGATLSATSVGITARVFKDLHATERPESRIVLGAAVLDDVLGLIVLAVVTTIASRGALPGPFELAAIVAMASAFLVGALVVGAYVMPGVYMAASRLKNEGVLGLLSFAFCLLLAAVSEVVGLAPIVGAYAAGLVLDEVHVRPFNNASTHELRELISPLVALFAPVFFVRTGMAVHLESASSHAIVLGLALAAVGALGKIAAGFVVRDGGVDRLAIGLGMVPRGEVGLIFADVGSRIVFGGQALLDRDFYMAIVLMVVVTTVITPPALAARLRAHGSR